jgi:hypothetical protein
MTQLIFSVVRHKGPSVGEIGEHLATGLILTKDGASSALLLKRKKKCEKRKEKKREKRRLKK